MRNKEKCYICGSSPKTLVQVKTKCGVVRVCKHHTLSEALQMK